MNFGRIEWQPGPISFIKDAYLIVLKFVFSKKATKIDEIFTVDLILTT